MTKQPIIQLVRGEAAPEYRAPDLDHSIKNGLGLRRDYATAAALFEEYVETLPLEKRPDYIVRHRIYRLAQHAAAVREQLVVERSKVNWIKGLRETHGVEYSAVMAQELMDNRLKRLRGVMPSVLYDWDQGFMLSRAARNSAGFACLPPYLKEGFIGWEQARKPDYAGLGLGEAPAVLSHAEYVETFRHLNRCTGCAREFLIGRSQDAIDAHRGGFPGTIDVIRSAVRYGRKVGRG